MALQTQYSRSRSARARSASGQNRASGSDLHEMSRSKMGIAEFAEGHSLKAKSEVGVEQARRRESRGRQAWAPPMRHSLESSSARFQLDSGQTLPPHPGSTAGSGVSSSGSQNTKVWLEPSFTKHTALTSIIHTAVTNASQAEDAVHLEQLDKLREIFDVCKRALENTQGTYSKYQT